MANFLGSFAIPFAQKSTSNMDRSEFLKFGFSRLQNTLRLQRGGPAIASEWTTNRKLTGETCRCQVKLFSSTDPSNHDEAHAALGAPYVVLNWPSLLKK